jgi:hypothetical protein
MLACSFSNFFVFAKRSELRGSNPGPEDHNIKDDHTALEASSVTTHF